MKPTAVQMRVVSMQASYLPPGGLAASRTWRPTLPANSRAVRQDTPRAVIPVASNTALPLSVLTLTIAQDPTSAPASAVGAITTTDKDATATAKATFLTELTKDSNGTDVPLLEPDARRLGKCQYRHAGREVQAARALANSHPPATPDIKAIVTAYAPLIGDLESLRAG